MVRRYGKLEFEWRVEGLENIFFLLKENVRGKKTTAQQVISCWAVEA